MLFNVSTGRPDIQTVHAVYMYALKLGPNHCGSFYINFSDLSIADIYYHIHCTLIWGSHVANFIVLVWVAVWHLGMGML